MNPRPIFIAVACALPLAAASLLVGCEVDCTKLHNCGPYAGDPVAQGGGGGTSPTGGGGGNELPPDVGEPCDGADDCENGFCVDGVCCENSCDDACSSCNVDGAMPGLCLPEAAGTTCDEGKCDGAGVCATGDLLWAQLLGSGGERVHDVAPLADGGSVIGGKALELEVDFGGNAVLPPSTTGRAFIVAHDAAGEGSWAVGLGGSDGTATVLRLRATAAGTLLAAGVFTGTLDAPGLGAPPSNTSGYGRGFILALDASRSHLWHSVFSSATVATQPTAFAMDEDHVAVVFDGSPYRIELLSHGSGNSVHSSTWSHDGEIGPGAGAAFVGEGLWVMTTYNDEATVESVPLPMPEVTKTNLVLVHHQSPGWSPDPADVLTFGGAETLQVFDMAAVGDDGFVIVGKIANGTLNLGSETIQAGAQDTLFVAAFGSDGACQWSRSVSTTGAASVDRASIVVDPVSAAIVVAGDFHGNLDFGAGSVITSINPAGFLFKLSRQGDELLWLNGYTYTDSEMTEADAVIAPDGSIMFSATTYGDWFSMPESGNGGTEVLLLRVAP